MSALYHKNPHRSSPAFELHDLSYRRRVFAVGDIHGCFSLLEHRLRELNFNPEKDTLVSTGDLIDRGPESHLAVEWINKMLRVTGNHEQLMAKAAYANPGSDDYDNFYNQGGNWIDELPNKSQVKCQADMLWDAPLALEILTPGGNRIGIAHARVPGNDWEHIKAILQDPKHPEFKQTENDLLWCRNHIKPLLSQGSTKKVKNIDHVFFGHTPVEKPIRYKNCTWLDTRAYKKHTLTVVDVDRWIGETEKGAW